MVEKPMEVGIDDLHPQDDARGAHLSSPLRRSLDMAIAWSGFPLQGWSTSRRPLGSAKYVKMTTFLDPKMAPGQRKPGIRGPMSRA